MRLLLIVLIILLLFGGIGVGPWWGHSAGWGYVPVGGVGFIVVLLLVLVLIGAL